MTDSPQMLEAESAFADDDFLVDLKEKYQSHPKRKRLPKLPKGEPSWKLIRNVAQKMGISYTHVITRGLDGEVVPQAEVADPTKLSEIDKAFLNALAAERDRLGLSRQDVADRMESYLGAVNKVESGDPSFSMIQKYAAAVGLTYSHSIVEFPNVLEDNRELIEEKIAALTAAGKEKDVYRLTRVLLQSYHAKGSNKTREDLVELLDSYPT